MGLTDPDTSVVCWLFCRTLNTFWFYLGVVLSLLSIVSGIACFYNSKLTGWFLLATGLLIAPTGFINLVPFYFIRKSRPHG
jgi:purine-cytosine permease-like protein